MAMALSKVIAKARRLLLCCKRRKQKGSLDIGSPTDVRRIDISDALPGLADAERKYIREKASCDAIHLLGLQSHPPSQSATSPPSPTESRSSLGPASRMSSREPSEALLNAASKDLPSSLPTPPRQKHNESSPPAAHMKSMWESQRRPSSTSTRSKTELYEKLERVKSNQLVDDNGRNESFMTLNLEFAFGADDKGLADTPRTLSLTTEGFETQSTVGGRSEASSPPVAVKTLSPKTQNAIKATALDDGSDSEDDVIQTVEQIPLVGI